LEEYTKNVHPSHSIKEVGWKDKEINKSIDNHSFQIREMLENTTKCLAIPKGKVGTRT